jgi:pimeloyl-[acyl-carrier protein] synthase
MPSQYDLYGPDVFTDPYPLYHRIRAKYPVHLDSHLGCWVVTSYAEVASALANRCLSSERARRGAALREKAWDNLTPLFKDIANLMFFADPPRHTQIRSLINKAFSGRMVEKWRPRIQMIVDNLLAEMQSKGRMDVIHDLALPLPLQVIADMMGIPFNDCTQCKLWADDLAYFLGNPPTLIHSTRLMNSLQVFMEYFREIVVQHCMHPRDDLVNALLHAEDQGIVLTEEELLVNCVGLFGGAYESPANLIGNGLLALLRHPEEMQRLRASPALIANAIEEFLRYDSPVQYTARIAKQTTTIGMKQIHEGQSVMLMLGAANRDPLRFSEPDRLDIGRQDNRHLAFGYSTHYCIGAALARLEGQIAISTILRCMHNIKLEHNSLEWHENLAFHGVKELWITFS